MVKFLRLTLIICTLSACNPALPPSPQPTPMVLEVDPEENALLLSPQPTPLATKVDPEENALSPSPQPTSLVSEVDPEEYALFCETEQACYETGPAQGCDRRFPADVCSHDGVKEDKGETDAP